MRRRLPRCTSGLTPKPFNDTNLRLPEALGGLLRGWVTPRKQDDGIHQSMTLHGRDKPKPTGIRPQWMAPRKTQRRRH